LRTRVVQEADAFDALRHAWDELLKEAEGSRVFLTWEWLASWWRVFGEKEGRRLWIVIAEDGNGLQGIAPMYRRTRRYGGILPCTEIHFLGDDFVGSDFLDFIVRKGREDDVVRAFRAVLCADDSWDRLVLDDTEEDAASIRRLQAVTEGGGGIGRMRSRPRFRCPFIDLPDNWEAFMELPERVYKRIVAKEHRRLERRHEMEFRFNVPAERVPDVLERMFVLHAERWQAADKTGTFADERVREFFKLASVSLAEKGYLRLSTLHVDDSIVAVDYGLAYDGVHFLLQGGCSREGRQVKAGNVMQYLICRELVGDPSVHRMEFLRGDERYKYQWGCRDRGTRRVCLARTTRGATGCLADIVAHRIKKVLKPIVARRQR